jgi:hypothetical protein
VPDVHVPKLDAHGSGKSIFKLVLEVALISVGVFLGLAGEQWRETRHQRELAQQSLQRFKTEIEANSASVTRVKDYHAKLFEQLSAAAKMTPAERDVLHIKFNGVQSAVFTHAAWDLALATQALPKNEEAFFGAILLYYGDMVLFEPALAKMYDDLLPKLDAALGEKK